MPAIPACMSEERSSKRRYCLPNNGTDLLWCESHRMRVSPREALPGLGSPLWGCGIYPEDGAVAQAAALPAYLSLGNHTSIAHRLGHTRYHSNQSKIF